MNKDGIINFMHDLGMKKKDAEKALELVLDAIAYGLKEDNEVKIFKFGRFRAKMYDRDMPAGWADNRSARKKCIRFNASDFLRDRVTPTKQE